MSEPQKKRLVLRSHANGTHTVELDGQPLSFVSRVELAVDAQGCGEARLSIPAEILDVEADVAAFVTAHSDQTDDNEPTVNLTVEGSALTKQDVADAVRAVMYQESSRGRPPGRFIR